MGEIENRYNPTSISTNINSSTFTITTTKACFKVDLIEPGRIICSMKVPTRLLNSGNFLHSGASASLVDIIGSAAIFTSGANTSGVSIEISISYLDSAYLDRKLKRNTKNKLWKLGKAVKKKKLKRVGEK
ncbi:hypothetical protein MKX01_013729 [Papaver californicum]|nr:hypothetical protein MKX01_013729 [Papaver californicum]